MNGIYHIEINMTVRLVSLGGCQVEFQLRMISSLRKRYKVQFVLQMLKRNNTSLLYDYHEQARIQVR